MINYYLLTKPGILMGNLITLLAGFMLASKGHFNLWLLLQTGCGLACIMASGCIFNNYIDRHIDSKMQRTKERALAKGSIDVFKALSFATALGLAGMAILWMYTNAITLALALFGFVVYVLLYSPWKCRTVHGTAIGSLAGAVPPVVGYCAVSNRFDEGALILFLIMIFWQMPHFLAIALWRLDDYKAAGVLVLPAVKGIERTKSHMLLYIVGFIFITASLTFYKYTGYVYLFVALSCSVMWLRLCLKGFKASDAVVWGRQMFRFSLLVIFALSLVISFDTL